VTPPILPVDSTRWNLQKPGSLRPASSRNSTQSKPARDPDRPQTDHIRSRSAGFHRRPTDIPTPLLTWVVTPKYPLTSTDENAPDGVRDAEAAGSSPAFPTRWRRPAAATTPDVLVLPILAQPRPQPRRRRLSACACAFEALPPHGRSGDRRALGRLEEPAQLSADRAVGDGGRHVARLPVGGDGGGGS
jgi:hypothetical protein